VAHDVTTQQVRLCEAILRHIREHPLAADTAEGILACWLPRGGFEDAPDYIATVLEDMVDKRWLQVVQLPDGKILYVRGDTRDS
jgi:hypothetical protein